MWLLLAFLSAALLGFYDAFKKKSLRGNAVLPVLFLNTLFDYTDFTSFSKLHTDVKTNNCRIMHAAWTQVDDVTWVFTIRADRFLRNMVRAIVGTLLDVGRGKLTVEDFRRIIEQKDRCRAGTSAPAEGLFLADITYPDDLFL